MLRSTTLFTLLKKMPQNKTGTTVLEPKERKSPSITKEELGRATWALLHMVAAQFPDRPSKRQKLDARNLMHIISRIYPCKECADHFKEILKENPVNAESKEEFQQWMCHVHNVVNRSLGKETFPCEKVNEKWVKFGCKAGECDEADE